MALLFGTEVKICYIIATIPRTGSHVLCESLASTGISGSPKEPFALMNYPILCDQWGSSRDIPFKDYLSLVVKNSTTPNGVCGIKIQWNQIERLRKYMAVDCPKNQVLDWLFPNAVYINLVRRDLRALAISFYRASMTNMWWEINDVVNHQAISPDPPYNSEQIRFWEKKFSTHQNKWSKFFQERDMLLVEYDDLEKNWCYEAARCLTYMGLNSSAMDMNFQTTFARQADAITRVWRKRLDEEDAKKEVK